MDRIRERVMRARASTFTFLCLLAALSLAGPGGGEDPGPAPPPPAGEVDLGTSFRIPQEEAKQISHTPAVVFTRDGERMLTATSDGQVVVFDVASREVRKRIRLPAKATDGVAIDAAGKVAVWALAGGGLAVLDLESGKVVARAEKIAARWLAVDPAAKRVAVTSGKTIEIRDLATLERVGEPIACASEVTNIAWSPDGGHLAFTTKGGRVVVRDERGHVVLESKKGTPQYAVAFSPDGKRLAFGGHDRQVREADLATKKETVISHGQPYWITCLGYSPDGERIAVGDESCDIWLYQISTRKRLFHNKHHVECWLSCVGWAPDNETFLFGCRPNGHAGRPSLHLPLTRAEAARTVLVRESRRNLLAAVDAAIGRSTDEAEKASLRRYRAGLVAEENPAYHGEAMGGSPGGGSMGAGGGGGDSGGLEDGSFGVGGTSGAGRGAVPPSALPEDLRKLAEEHDRKLREEMEKLRRVFCVNPWKAR
jgi:uncharacterized membrane protein YgcG